MEKFGAWRDKLTGVHPFLPVRAKRPALAYVLALPFVVLRLPFVAVIALWLVIISLLAVPLRAIPVLHRLFTRYTLALGCRTLLFVLGFHYVQTQSIHLGKRTRTLPMPSVAGKGIIVSNHSSYIDILYYAFRCAPLFAFTVRCRSTPSAERDASDSSAEQSDTSLADDSLTRLADATESADVSTTLVLPCTLFDALAQCLSQAPVDVDNEAVRAKLISIDEALARASAMHQPLLVFAEGCTGNGRLVLQTPPLRTAAKQEAVVAAVKYTLSVGWWEEPVPYTVGSALVHFLMLMGSPNHSMNVRYTCDEKRVDLGALDNDDTETLAATIASLLRLRRAASGAKQKRAFVEYWYHYHEGYAAKRRKKRN